MSSGRPTSRYGASTNLYDAARRVIPGGVAVSRKFYGGEDEPLFFTGGHGGICTDVDGNSYTDFLLGFGAILLGFDDAELQTVLTDQLRNGLLLSQYSPLQVEVARQLVEQVPAADFALLAKTGSCATTAAVRIARAYTGRDIVVRCGYNGWHDWTTAGTDLGEGVPKSMADMLHEFPGTAEGLAEYLRTEGDRVAAVIVVPEDLPLAWHDVPVDTYATEIARMQAATRQAGALFIMDEVKTGIRSELGSFQAQCGLEPDLTTVSKGLGNGLPLAAVLGREALRDTAERVYTEATYQTEMLSLAAANHILGRRTSANLAGKVNDNGRYLIRGLNEVFAANNLSDQAVAWASPIPAMPEIRFHPEKRISHQRRRQFTRVALERGVSIHPIHVSFVALAHDEPVLDSALDRIGDALAECSPMWS